MLKKGEGIHQQNKTHPGRSTKRAMLPELHLAASIDLRGAKIDSGTTSMFMIQLFLRNLANQTICQ
jgi:hypothetical protein